MRWFLIDRVVELRKGKLAKTIKNVTLGEDHLHDHFPGFPIMPHSLIIESMAQTGGILAGSTTDFKEKVVLAKIERAKFYDLALPGDQLLLEAEMVEEREEGCKVSGKVTVNGKLIAEIRLMFVNLRSSNGQGEEPNFVFNESFMSALMSSRIVRRTGSFLGDN